MYLHSRVQLLWLLRLCVIRRLSDSDLEFLEPFGLVLSMNHAAQEPKRLGNIVAVEPDSRSPLRSQVYSPHNRPFRLVFAPPACYL